MIRGLKFTLAIAILASAPGLFAQAHICGYANDDITASNGLNGIPNTVDGYNIAGATITYLSPVTMTNGYGVAGGYLSGGRIAAIPSTNNLYAENDYSRTIGHLIINPADCTLTYDNDYPDGDSKTSREGDPIAVTPNGKYLYVADNGNYFGGLTSNIQLLKVATNGSLSAPVSQSTPVSDYAAQLVVAPNGKVLLATFPDIGQVCAYTIAANGSLGAAPSCSTIGSFVTGVTVDSASKCVYLGQQGTQTSVDAGALSATGTLGTFTSYTGTTLGSGRDSNDVALSSNGKVLFISNNESNQITSAKVGANCVLSKGTVSPTGGLAGHDTPAQLAVSGTTVLLADYNQTGGMTAPAMGLYAEQSSGALLFLGSVGLNPLTTEQISAVDSIVEVSETD